MKGEKLGDVGRPARVPRDEGGNGAFAEDGDHVPQPVRVLRVLLQDLEETRVHAGVEDAGAGVVGEHALMPEDVDEIERRRRGWRSHGDGFGEWGLWNRRLGFYGEGLRTINGGLRWRQALKGSIVFDQI